MVLGDLFDRILTDAINHNESDHCEACGGLGYRAPASPSCRLPPIGKGFEVIERCDTCEAYNSDLDAAMAITCEVAVITCEADGTHVIGRM